MLRTPVSDSDRQRLISAYENGRDYIETARVLGIQRRTACEIILIFKRTGRRHALSRGGRRPHIINDEMHEHLLNFVGEKPTATLDEMKANLLDAFPLRPVSVSTIARHLDGCLITLKLLRTVTCNWNTEEVKNERVDYARWMLSTGVTRRLVFTDECGLNVWTARSQGRSARGSRAVRIVDGQRGRNLTVCLAVSQHYGLVHYACVTGGMTKEMYGLFLSEVSTLLEDDALYIVHDNAPPHRQAPSFQEHHCIQALPRYSPFLNPTEEGISSFKSALKRHLSQPTMQLAFGDRESARRAARTLHEHRLHLLRDAIDQTIGVITIDKCVRWHGHAMSYIQKCLEKQDIFH